MHDQVFPAPDSLQIKSWSPLSIDYVSDDGGDTYHKKFTYPESLDSKRLKIRYNEEGGLEKDGIIELRRGVPDLSLGDSRYSQVRILVDGTHYLKGMAVYSDNMPDGVDVIFNTNKSKGTPMTDVLKKINLSINELEQLMNKYLFDVYVKNVKYIKQNGLNNQSVIINPNLFDN